MANVKISALPAITSSDDLASADILPLVDNSDSTTKKVSLSVLNNFFGGTYTNDDARTAVSGSNIVHLLSTTLTGTNIRGSNIESSSISGTSLFGDGSNITALNASEITSGTLTRNLNITTGESVLNDVVIANDLKVQGTTTTVSAANLNIVDPIIGLAKDQTGTPTTDLGLIGERGDENNAGIIWDESADQWATILTTNNASSSGNITVSSYTDFRVKDATVSSVYIGGTSTANQLDNYVEGTFTPTLSFGSGSVTLSTAEGYYTRIGNLVYITIKLIISALSSPSGAMTLGALPITAANNTGGEGIGGVVATKLKFQTNIGYIPNATNIVVRVVKNTTTAKISFSDDNVAYFDATADSLNADTEIQTSFFYQAG